MSRKNKLTFFASEYESLQQKENLLGMIQTGDQDPNKAFRHWTRQISQNDTVLSATTSCCAIREPQSNDNRYEKIRDHSADEAFIVLISC
jgi:hypothetical protein